MKKCALLILVLLCCGLAACAAQRTPPDSMQDAQQEPADRQCGFETPEDQPADGQQPEPALDDAETPETETRKVKLIIDGQAFDVTLYDTPAAQALYEMLPLALTFEDFNGIEKIAYMDAALPIEGEPEAFDPTVGDLCLYAPWGNLTIFYEDFRSESGLISLGHIDSGVNVIAGMSENFSARLEKTG